MGVAAVSGKKSGQLLRMTVTLIKHV